MDHMDLEDSVAKNAQEVIQQGLNV